MGCFKLTYHPEFLHLCKEAALEKSDHETAVPHGKKYAGEKNCIDYYPFGLTFNSYSRENSVANQYKYVGTELQDELNLVWLDYGNRMYMPDIGRWGVQDPVSESYFTYSPYNYVRNNPILRIDVNGNWDITVHVANDREQYGYGFAVVTDRNGNEVYRFIVRAQGTAGTDRMVQNADTPLGVYDIPDQNMWIAGSTSGSSRGAYGPNHRLIMTPESGEILDSGRDLIRIHGGRQEEFVNGEWQPISDQKLLKKTQGCLRAYDSDIARLKEITDELQANDSEELGGKVTVVADYDKYMEERTQQNEAQQNSTENQAFWNNFNTAAGMGLDVLSAWLRGQGFPQN